VAVEVVRDAEAAAAASVAPVAPDVAAAAGGVAAGAMPSGSVISRPPAAHPGEGAACAKSHDLTARLSRLRVKTSKSSPRADVFRSAPGSRHCLYEYTS